MRVVLTPQRAQALLDNNIDNNRRMSKARINRYLSDMRNGLWRYNGESIKVNVHGKLIDGQQRLKAITLYGKPVEIELIEGLPADVETSLDQGRSRSTRDALFMRDVPNPLITGPAAKFVLNYLDGFNPRQTQSTAAVEDFLSEFDLTEVAARCDKLKGIIPPSPVAAVVYLGSADGVRNDLAETFLEGVTSGVGLFDGDPRLALRSSIANNRGRQVGKRSVDTTYAIHATIRAWNAWCENRQLTVTRYSVARAGSKKANRLVTPDIRGAPRFGAGVAGLRRHIDDARRR